MLGLGSLGMVFILIVLQDLLQSSRMGRNMKTRLGYMNTMSLAGLVDAPTPSFYVHVCSELPLTKSRCFEIKSWQNPSMLKWLL